MSYNKPSDYCKAVGLRSLNQSAELVGLDAQALRYIFRRNKRHFHALLIAAVVIRAEREIKHLKIEEMK